MIDVVDPHSSIKMKQRDDDHKKPLAAGQPKIPKLKSKTINHSLPDSQPKTQTEQDTQDINLTKNKMLFSVAQSTEHKPQPNPREYPNKKEKLSGNEKSDAALEKRNGRWDKEEKEKFIEGKSKDQLFKSVVAA